MSRIGKRVLTIPEKVTVLVDGQNVNVKGPKGELSTNIRHGISVIVNEQNIEVKCQKDEDRKHQGTVNALINNMLIGVTEGFSKTLEIVGVGYRFSIKGNVLVIASGYSKPTEFEIPKEITVENPSNNQIIIKGIDKWLVGEFAANVRKVKQPEPYKGKGIRYIDEHIIRKVGKKAAK